MTRTIIRNNNINRDYTTIFMCSKFEIIVAEFAEDIMRTFPELTDTIFKWWKPKSHFTEEAHYETYKKKSLEIILRWCTSRLPSNFFAIVNKDPTLSVEVFPGVEFSKLIHAPDISDTTRETLWNYLHVLLVAVTETTTDKTTFGDSSEGGPDFLSQFSSPEFQKTFASTLENINSWAGAHSTELFSGENIDEHIGSLFDGKVCSIAKEIASDLMGSMNGDPEQIKTLWSNPEKMMSMMKLAGDKLNSKIQAGELNESDITSESARIMEQLKNIPGLGNLSSLFSDSLSGGDNKKKKNRFKESREKFERNKITKETHKQMEKAFELIRKEVSQNPDMVPRGHSNKKSKNS